MTPNPIPADPRTKALNGLRDLVAFLDAHPHIPVPTAITIEPRAAHDTDGFEQLARIAHHMGARPISTPNGTQRVSRAFGPVTFSAVYHPVVLP
jgi:hypothetical protein